MSSRPFVRFWVDDFLSSPRVRRYNAHLRGTYTGLLWEQWQSESDRLEDSAEVLADLTKSDTEAVEKVLAENFKKERGGWFNARLRTERQRTDHRIGVARENGKRGGRPTSTPTDNPVGNPTGSDPVRQTDNQTVTPEKASQSQRTNSQSQIQNQTSPSLSAREAGVGEFADAPDYITFNEFWELGGKGPMMKGEQAYFNAVPSQISHDDLVKAFTAYKANLDGAHEMNTGNWISQKGYADTTLFTKASGKDSYFDEVPE